MLSISCSLNLRLVIINGLRQLFNFAFWDFVPGAKKPLSSFTSFIFCFALFIRIDINRFIYRIHSGIHNRNQLHLEDMWQLWNVFNRKLRSAVFCYCRWKMQMNDDNLHFKVNWNNKYQKWDCKHLFKWCCKYMLDSIIIRTIIC